MAKKSRASKIYDEEEELMEKSSINNIFADKDEEELMSINRALEQEKEETDNVEEQQTINEQTKAIDKEQQKNAKTEAASKGIKIPPAKAKRDPKKDKDPIEGEDLGLEEDSFLLSRKVTKQDLEINNKINEEGLLGSNMNKYKKFLDVFKRGPSSDKSPKVDTMYSIENNDLIQKEVAATQLLRNYHSKDNKEKSNTHKILLELKLEEDLIKKIKDDKKAYKDENLIDLIKNML